MKHIIKFLAWSLKHAYREYRLSGMDQVNAKLALGVRIISPEHLFVEPDVVIESGAYLHCGHMEWCKNKGGIRIGKGSYLGVNCVLFGMGEIEIGNNVMISPHVTISSIQHDYSNINLPMNKQPHIFEKVCIADDVYIGSNAVITPGVTLGKGSVIGAGAVVTKDIEEYGIAFGVPAKVVRKRN